MRYHFSTMTKIKKTITNVDEIGKKLEPYMLLLRMLNGAVTLEKFENPSKYKHKLII